ncbi:MAG: aspartate aminotransferase family protein [Planctomycetes bacterium]|nr:aspartate aminotransferase family protein [Planctomycetota bacterium]
MTPEEFARHGHALVDRIARYFAEVEDYPVRSPVRPGAIRDRLPAAAPEHGEPMEQILADFESVILPGMTHWQHPSFFAYFPANSSPPSVLGELLTAGLGAQCMLWETGPAAAELEERMMEWLRDALGLPAAWTGVIQDTASTATLCALLCARERATDLRTNREGLRAAEAPLTLYASEEIHSSVVKGAKIAGYGEAWLRLIPTDENLAMRPDALRRAIEADLARGFRPACVTACLGTTSSTAFDSLAAIGPIAREHGLWLHVDAALAGSAALLEEKRWMLEGIEHADSFVFNPHKWLFTNFDLSAYFVRDPSWLVRTFEIHPEYLKTDVDQRVKNYRDWGVPLGRRFRALKLWFVLRNFGLEGLRARLREHLRMADRFREWVDGDADFERLAPVPLNLVCFRFRPAAAGGDEARLEALNARLLGRLNDSGRLYLTHTRVRGTYALRLCVGQTYTEERHVRAAWEAIRSEAARLVASDG